MFREPDPLAEQVSQALLAMSVVPLEERGEWIRIRTWDAYEGWARSAAFRPDPTGWDGEDFRIVDLWANLRARPDYRQAAATRAPLGTLLPRTGAIKGWVELLLPDGRRLWTEEHRVRAATCRTRRSQRSIITTARRFLGVPYLWGGNSPDGIDCSGFVQFVMRLHGIPLLRDADMQFGQGQPVSEPQATDLVFFGPADRPEAITHVGMMLDRRRFIHARGSAHVRIDLLQGYSHSGSFRGARRFR